MSIVHRALKKAEQDEQNSARLDSGSSTKSHDDAKSPSIKRISIILAIFLVLLAFVLYFPDYYKNKKLKEVKQNITIKPLAGDTVIHLAGSTVKPLAGSTVKPLAGYTVKPLAGSTVKPLAGSADDPLAGSAEIPLAGSSDDLNKRGVYFYKNGEHNKAYLHFKDALKKDKTNHEIYNNLGLVLKKQKKFKEALSSYTSAISLNAGYKEAHNNLGVLYDKLGQYDEAVKAFKKAIDIDKAYKDPYFNIALTYEKMKKYKLASVYYEDYLGFVSDDDSAFIKGVRKKVEILKNISKK